MRTLRRASTISIRAQEITSGAFRACSAVQSASICVVDQFSNTEQPKFIPRRGSTLSRFCQPVQFPFEFSLGSRCLSSQAGATGGDELDDEFSELDKPGISETVQDTLVENDNELVSGPEKTDDDDDEGEESFDSFEDNLVSETEAFETLQCTLGDDDNELVSGPELTDVDEQEESPEAELTSDSETDTTDTTARRTRFSLDLYRAIAGNQFRSVPKILDKYVTDGKSLSRADISDAMLCLRKRKLYAKALQLSEWLETSDQIEFLEPDYASRLDLIAKVHGLQKAEKYVDSVPEPCRGEVLYRTLLVNYVSTDNVKKAEEVFNRMKDLDFPVTAFACNQLLLLYKRNNKTRIAEVLQFMEKEDIKPDSFTYNILIDSKGQSRDIDGMDQVVEMMKAEGLEPDLRTQAALARHYAACGLREKAEEILKSIESSNLKLNRGAHHILLPIYANLGNADEVGRLWRMCKTRPTQEECMAAIEAWGRLKKIKEAEEVFDHMIQTFKKLSSRHYVMLMKAYAKHKMLSKGKDLARRMGESGCHIGPVTWDALVKLYVGAGEVEKADSILQKAIRQNQGKPLFSSFMTIMEQYAKRGDVHNSEKLFLRMKQAGYVARVQSLQTLLQAYVNAKTPAYGFRERIKAENVFPNKVITTQLALVDGFRKTAVSDLLD